MVVEGVWIDGKLQGRTNLKNFSDGKIIAQVDFYGSNVVLSSEIEEEKIDYLVIDDKFWGKITGKKIDKTYQKSHTVAEKPSKIFG